eukprot:7057094-Alexandrium_andersonii.AAC.1
MSVYVCLRLPVRPSVRLCAYVCRGGAHMCAAELADKTVGPCIPQAQATTQAHRHAHADA